MIELTPQETRLLLSALRLLSGEVEPSEWLDRLIEEVNTKDTKTLTLQLNTVKEDYDGSS